MVSVTFLLRYLYGGKGKIVSLIEITIQKDLPNSPFSQKMGEGIISVTLCLSSRPPLDNALLIFSFKESLEMCIKNSAVDQINLLPLRNYNF